MKQVTFTLRALTPLFLAGADQTTAELRAPSFRGLMRYWYRALAGGLGADLETIGKCETAVFGATDQGSAVSVRISKPSANSEEFRKESRRREDVTGGDYLFWSMARNNNRAARWYFPSGTNFRVTLSTQGSDMTALKQAVATFWLLTQLGGIGARSRRCAGSLVVQRVDNDITPLPFNIAEDSSALKSQLEQGIRKVQGLVKTIHQLDARTITRTQFDVLTQGVCRIWILQDEQPWSSAEIAVQELGADLQDYRGSIFPVARRKIFGLPLPPITKRRSSPLLLRVVELQGKKYVGLAVLFKTTDNDVRAEDYKVIENWIEAFSGKKEVRL